MPLSVTTIQGDMLDAICHRHYRKHAGTVEAVFAANPGLCWEPQPYRAGVSIILPEIAGDVSRDDTQSLWD